MSFEAVTKSMIVMVLMITMASAHLTNGMITHVPRQSTPATDVCGKQEIRCICGIGASRRIISVEIKLYPVNVSKDQTECVGVSDPYQTCASHSCFLSSDHWNATTNGSAGATVSPSHRLKKSIAYSFYPKEIVIPPRADGPKHRVPRQSEPCFIPQLQNAEIKCWKWPNWMNCDITCIFGHALQGKKDIVSTTNINCRNTENVWKPHGFRDCQPYLNCKTELVKPGNLKCKVPISGPPFCEISCLDYDQYDATGLQKYECVDDSFERTLPHCAKLNKNVELIRKPQS